MVEPENRLGRLLLGPLVHEPAVVRERLLATVLQTKASLVITSSSLLLIALTSAAVSNTRWAWMWALLSCLIVLLRLTYPSLARHHSLAVRRANIMVASAVLFVLFGMGCALAIRSQDLTLVTMSLCATIGIVAGLASRWAALPRAAITTMLLVSFSPIAALATLGGTHVIAAVAMSFVIASIGAFTLQNHRNLLAAIRTDERSAHLARTDALTGLNNRSELTRRLEQSCLELAPGAASRLRCLALLYLDLDGFKTVNDQYGHATGDALLRRVAQCLRATVGANHTIARIGGDEFIVLLEDAGEPEAQSIADRIIANISCDQVLPEAGRSVRVGCSVGMSLAPQQGCEPELLMARADAALYAVKSRGKGQSGLWRTLG